MLTTTSLKKQCETLSVKALRNTLAFAALAPLRIIGAESPHRLHELSKITNKIRITIAFPLKILAPPSFKGY